MATDTEIAWAAGLFEGEGTWLLRKGKGAHPQIALQMCDRDVVERFARIVGVGREIRVERRSLRNPAHSDMWRWELTNVRDARHLIEMLVPYLGERRRAKAEEIMRATEGYGQHGRSKYATHCKRGHPFDEANTGYNRFRGANGKMYTTRFCKTCRRAPRRMDAN